MKWIYITISITIFTFGVEKSSITIHKTEDITVTIPDGDDKLDFHKMLQEIDLYHRDLENPTPPSTPITPSPIPKTFRERIFTNRTALIAATGTITSGIIAGTVALIVHFTKAG